MSIDLLYMYVRICVCLYIHVEVFVVLWLLPYEMNTKTHVQFLGETVYVSHRINTFGKGTNPIILSTAMGK